MERFGGTGEHEALLFPRVTHFRQCFNPGQAHGIAILSPVCFWPFSDETGATCSQDSQANRCLNTYSKSLKRTWRRYFRFTHAEVITSCK